jgi:hypothetical protein
MNDFSPEDLAFLIKIGQIQAPAATPVAAPVTPAPSTQKTEE